MLTRHEYVPVDPNWDKDTIQECCKKDPADEGCTDCCYDSWQDELKKVTPAYYHAVELSSQLQSKVNFVASRRDRYKTWLDELTRAEELSAEVCYELKLIAVQSDKIWFNSCKASEAIDILFCMIRDMYYRVDRIKEIYDSLQNCITRLNDPSLIPGQGILQSLAEYRQKLEAVLKTRDEILKSIMEAIKLANLIRNSVSTRECPDGEGSFNPCLPHPEPCISLTGGAQFGLKTLICEWYHAFACDVECTGSSSQQSRGRQQNPGREWQKSDCHDEACELLPTFDFPICNNTYKTEVEEWYKSDDAYLKELTEKLNQVKIEKETLLACKISLDNAIKATDPKLRCK